MWISGTHEERLPQKAESPEKPAAVRRVAQENDVATTPASAPSPKKEEIKPTREKETVVEDSRKDESMGGVLQEAAKMLRSLNASQGVKKVDERNDRLDDLQKQLNGLRSGSLKMAQVNAQGRWSDGGLLDSGATHPLRARQEGEDIENLDEIDVALDHGGRHHRPGERGRGLHHSVGPAGGEVALRGDVGWG